MSSEIKILSRSNAIKESHLAWAWGKTKPFIISMTDVMSPNPSFVYFNRCLMLKFDDHITDKPTAPQSEHAKSIVDFIESLPPDFSLISHCEAGICRSSAVALAAYLLKVNADAEAAKDYFKSYDSKIWPNQRLASLIESEAVQRGLLKPGQLTGLVEWINNQPLYWEKE
jgi:predicted protein tyrosine phosphatase